MGGYKIKDNKMIKKVFIDGGHHLGEGLSEFKTMLGITNDWEIHIFEPNIHCNFTEVGNNIHFHRKAIWTKNGQEIFNCEHNEASNSPKLNSNSNLDGWGSCLSILENTHSFEEQIQTETVDFSEFIKKFEGCEIYCKLDIEGAEFEVIRKLIKDGTISLINEIWVEWHHTSTKNEDLSTKEYLINEVSKYCKIHDCK